MLRIRLSRVGRKNQPFFKIVVIPRSAPTTGGSFKAELGTHDPVNNETTIDHEEARSWIAKGAQPTDTVHNLFIKHGVITGRKVAVHDKEPTEPEKEEEPKKEEPKEEKKEEKTEDQEESKEEPEEEKETKEEEKEETPKEEKKEEKEEEQTEDQEESKEEEEAEEEEKEEGASLESLDLTTRITNALEDAGIDSVEKLKEKSEEELSEIKGLGEKSIEKIMDALK